MNTKMETDVKKTFNFNCGSGGILKFTDLIRTPSPLARLSAADAKRKLEEIAKTHSCFILLRESGKISNVKIYFKTRLCVKYLQNVECSRGSKCNYWHICKGYMEGNCRKKNCQFSHDFKDDQNLKILEALELSQHPNNTIRKILSSCLPRVCKDYAKGRCTVGENCSKLHICSKLVEHLCPVDKVHCLFSHNPKSPANVSVLRKAELAPRLPHKILFSHILLPEQLPLMRCEFSSTNLGNEPLPNRLAVNEKVEEQESENASKIDDSPCKQVWSEAEWASKVNKFDKNKTLQAEMETTERYLHKDANQEAKQDQQGSRVPPSFMTARSRRSLHTDSKVAGEHLYEGSKKRYLCTDFILGKCHEATECDMHHFHLPYLWQCVEFPGVTKWKYFTEEENEEIEKSYCDVYTGSCSKSVDLTSILTCFFTEDKVVQLDFQDMTLKHKNLMFPLRIRRLSTRSHIDNDVVLATKWVWYWNDTLACGHKLWCPHGHKNAEETQKKIEGSFIDLAAGCSLSIEGNNYELVFSDDGNGEMFQEETGKGRKARREVRRRPQFRSKEDIQGLVKKKERMRLKRQPGESIGERKLFHGTSDDVIDSICKQNFDWRIHGKNAAFFGQGSYFARDAAYSHRFTSENSNSSRFMFLAKVLVGTYTKGESHMRRPPPKNNSDATELYDSCVNDVTHPSTFVIFDKDQYYPSHVIEYFAHSLVERTSSTNAHSVSRNVHSAVAQRGNPYTSNHHMWVPVKTPAPHLSLATDDKNTASISQKIDDSHMGRRSGIDTFRNDRVINTKQTVLSSTYDIASSRAVTNGDHGFTSSSCGVNSTNQTVTVTSAKQHVASGSNGNLGISRANDGHAIINIERQSVTSNSYGVTKGTHNVTSGTQCATTAKQGVTYSDNHDVTGCSVIKQGENKSKSQKCSIM